MNTGSGLDELLDQLASQAMAGRAVLLLSDDEDALSLHLGAITENMVDFGHEIIRMDGLEPTSPNVFIDRLLDLLQVEETALMDALALRAAQGNPVVFVLDNAHCFSDAIWRWFADVTGHPSPLLGLVLGGEPDAADFADTHGVKLALVAEVEAIDATGDAAASLSAGIAPAKVLLPWRHLAAIVGLLLLAGMFWMVGKREPDPEPHDVISLPVPLQPLEVTPSAPVVQEEPPSESVLPTEPEIPVTADLPKPPVTTAPVEPAKPAPPVATTPVQPRPATLSAPKPAAPVKPLAAHELRAADWLLLQADSLWMLQVLSAGSEPGAIQAVSELGADTGAYYQALRNGRTVYIVLAGPYASREIALKAASSLPAAYRNTGAFPRALSQIKQEIRSR